jgi:hypothetical protein
MAKRPVFVAEKGVVKTCQVNFKWHPGMSKLQKQKNVTALHEAAMRELGLQNILEISTKSLSELGRSLSAMSLCLYVSGLGRIPVECAFQGSKVFQHGGPYVDLFSRSPREAKRDPRLSTSGELVGFQFQDSHWGLEPKSAFYDWLYLKALQQNKDLASQLLRYDAFTDIEFNPRKSYSTQARACALYVCLEKSGYAIERLIGQREEFLRTLADVYQPKLAEDSPLLDGSCFR